MLNYGPAEFFGTMFFLPVLIYLTFAIFDGIGIFRDVFKTPERRVWRE
jgi:hypothetical protein